LSLWSWKKIGQAAWKWKNQQEWHRSR
jgi:hypothetical protein